jgi:hypothetical protein
MPTLFLSCKHCHAEFPTPIAVTEAGLGDVLITGLQHTCPHCGATESYYTQDYHVPTELLGQEGEEIHPPSPDEVDAMRTEMTAEKLSGFGVVPDPEAHKPSAGNV